MDTLSASIGGEPCVEQEGAYSYLTCCLICPCVPAAGLNERLLFHGTSPGGSDAVHKECWCGAAWQWPHSRWPQQALRVLLAQCIRHMSLALFAIWVQGDIGFMCAEPAATYGLINKRMVG